jgi:hypothetical protein
MTKSAKITIEPCAGQAREIAEEATESIVCPSTKMALTYEEEVILGQMRAVKEQVRPIAERLKELQYVVEQFPQAEAEWKDLSTRMEGLRAQWKDWERKLEEAVEQKLITLGHRSP